MQPETVRLVTEFSLPGLVAQLTGNRVIYSPTTGWPTRASVVGAPQAGVNVEYYSAPYTGAPTPTDMQPNDIWTKRKA